MSHNPTTRLIMYALLLIAILLRFDVFRKIDGSGDIWRESDVGAIARNFYQEGMNILYPRIDWRRDGPGYVESEFPAYSWGVAVLYKIFGYHEELPRILSFFFSALSCIIGLRLALFLLPSTGAIIAMAVFATNPLAVQLGSAIQAEPLMFAAYISGIYFFLRWLESGGIGYYLTALAGTAIAALAKIPALHVGILFAGLCIDRYGWRAFSRWKLYVFAVGVLVPTLLWYSHARNLWLQYGNSLGMSNEAYIRITSINFLKGLASTLIGVVRIEVAAVWMIPGCLLGLAGLLRAFRSRNHRVLLYWLTALGCLYALTGRTTGQSWATYYHIVSTPCAALLMGLSTSWILAAGSPKPQLKFLEAAVGAAGLALMVAGLRHGFPLEGYNLYSSGLGGLFIGTALAIYLRNRTLARKQLLSMQESVNPYKRALIIGTALLFGTVIAMEARRIMWYRLNRGPHPFLICAKRFQSFVPSGTLIAVNGGSRQAQSGIPRAYDRPYMFFWMNRKGFAIPDEDQSIKHLLELRRRGAEFFVGEKSNLAAKPGFEEELRRFFPIVAECGQAILFSLGDQ